MAPLGSLLCACRKGLLGPAPEPEPLVAMGDTERDDREAEKGFMIGDPLAVYRISVFLSCRTGVSAGKCGANMWSCGRPCNVSGESSH